MSRIALLLAMSVAGAAQAFAAEGRVELELKPKSALAATPLHASAPFISPATEPVLQLGAHPESRPERSRSACEADQALCYDAGHIVFKPARRFMPEIPGLKGESVSLKRDRFILRYSF
jgi:hypothetical protein